MEQVAPKHRHTQFRGRGITQKKECSIRKKVKLRNPDINPLNTKRRLLYLKTQFVPRSKHFSSRLYKPISLCCKWHKSLFVLR